MVLRGGMRLTCAGVGFVGVVAGDGPLKAQNQQAQIAGSDHGLAKGLWMLPTAALVGRPPRSSPRDCVLSFAPCSTRETLGSSPSLFLNGVGFSTGLASIPAIMPLLVVPLAAVVFVPVVSVAGALMALALWSRVHAGRDLERQQQHDAQWCPHGASLFFVREECFPVLDSLAAGQASGSRYAGGAGCAGRVPRTQLGPARERPVTAGLR